MRNLGRALVVAVLVAACNNAPSAPPATGAPGSSAPAPSEGAPGPTTVPQPSDSASETLAPSSFSKIADAQAAGTIDEPTALLYRLYANTGDSRLPAQYQGEWSEDNAAGDRARAVWPTLTADQQAALQPFLVRPTSPQSIWATPASASTGPNPQLASVRLA